MRLFFVFCFFQKSYFFLKITFFEKKIFKKALFLPVFFLFRKTRLFFVFVFTFFSIFFEILALQMSHPTYRDTALRFHILWLIGGPEVYINDIEDEEEEY